MTGLAVAVVTFCILYMTCNDNGASTGMRDARADAFVREFNKPSSGGGGNGGEIPTVPTVYTITLNANGGSGSPAYVTTDTNGILASLPTAPTLSDHTFDGWYTSSSDGTLVTTGYIFSANTTIYAHWTATSISNIYTITLNANGGSGSPAYVTTDTNGILASLPTAPTLSDHTFDGWYTSSSDGTLVTTGYTFSANTTIYAHWTATSISNIYTITLNANGGSGSPAYVNTGTNGKLASLPTAPTLSDHSFNGWYTAASSGDLITTDYIFSANTTIYAQWTDVSTPAVYTITFDINYDGGTNPQSATTSASGTLASLPNPARTDYTFDGWYSAPTDGTKITTSTVFNQNTTIYAQWTEDNPTQTGYTITFDINYTGGTNPQSATTSASGTLAALPNPARTDYTFDGWYSAPTDGTKITTSTVFNQNTTIYAQWTADTPTQTGYTITFNINYSGGANPQSATTSASGTLTALPTPTRTGYTFDSWYSAPTDGTKITTSTVFNANTTIYAQWTEASSGEYEYVELGGKNWMKKNLDIVTEGGSWCYNNSADSCAKYGRLYTWAAAKAACQSIGWRLPDTLDWRRLVGEAGDLTTAGIKLKSKTGWNGYSGIVNTNETGFSALPGGIRSTNGSFNEAGNRGFWWTATESSTSGYADFRYMSYDEVNVRVYGSDKGYGYSVRCVMND
jgi:uncharacterized protein (TIGR02145 family)/uncharacterized repeat protein (TIGR02543 family)